MLGNLRYQQYITTEHQLSTAAIEYINQTRLSEPARAVGINARTNIVAAEVSMKMGCTITSESHAERSIATQFEFDPEILEYWEQPPAIEVLKADKRGSRRRRSYTADFLVLSSTGPVVKEVKTLEEVEKAVESEPQSWAKTDSGFDFIPAREAYQLLYGLRFEVIVVTRRDQIIAENIRILLASRDVPLYEPTLGLKIDSLLVNRPLWRLDELLNELELREFTALIQMIDIGRLSFDMASASLSDPDRCYVAGNSALIIGDSHNEIRELTTIKEADDFQQVDTSQMPSSKIAEKVLKRLARIESGEKSSSVRRWKKQIYEGKEKGLTPFQALIDADKNISGRKSKLHPSVKTFLDDFIENTSLTMRTESSQQIYFEYCIQANDIHPKAAPVSTQTFYSRLKQIAPELTGEAKGGKRMAMAMAPPSDPKERYLAPRLPWMKASVDHCQVKISLVVYEDQENIYVARPWLSVMIDVATSEVLAFSISFQPPSRRSCAKLIRECVRRHGKLPREILTDHGSDFISVYFRSLLAHCRVTHSLRPAGNPRAGAESEGFFGVYRKEWLSQRPGYAMSLKTLRAIDGKKSPDKYAVLTIEDLYQELSAYIQWRSSKPIGTASKASALVYQERLRLFPFIPISQEYDHDFVLATSVESREYKIDFQRGIHIKELHYNCPQLRVLQGVKSKAEVRIDPENPFVVYVRINGKWHGAQATDYNHYIGQGLAYRIAEGIRVYECSAMRRRISQHKGIIAAQMRHSFDLDVEQRLISDAEASRVEPSSGSFDSQSAETEDNFKVREIPSEGWSL